MRRAVLALLLLAACDPVDKIRVRFPVQPSAFVAVRWVQVYEGRTYAHGSVFEGEVATDMVDVTRTECCGTAAAYRDGKLGFVACVQRPGAAAELVCGAPDQPSAVIRAPYPGGDCRTLAWDFDLDPARCQILPRATTPGGSGSMRPRARAPGSSARRSETAPRAPSPASGSRDL